MIFVSQGHENSIALEVFLKSFSLLSKSEQSNFTLVTFKDTLLENLNFFFSNIVVNENLVEFDDSQLSVKFIEPHKKQSQTLSSLLYCLETIQEGDRLVTLPSSKDQFKYEGKHFSGHTELFRNYFSSENLQMVFKFKSTFLMLITDHVPLNKVIKNISVEKIVTKVSSFLLATNTVNKIIFSGINPHAGESGMLGKEDGLINEAILELKIKFNHCDFIGPLAADSIFMKPKEDTLYVSMYHDQGLTAFKTAFSLQGVHLTLGLPFIRLSVDHGTAFELYGKNKADYSGCFYVLKDALNGRG